MKPLYGCTGAMTTLAALLLCACAPQGTHYGQWNLADPADAFRLRPANCSSELTAPQCEQVKAQQEAQLSQQRVAEADRQEAVSQIVKDEQRRGYNQKRFEDFLLDGNDLAAARAKVVVSGAYIRVGTTDLLFSSIPAEIAAQRTGSTDGAIGLLTDNAPRYVRRRLLECRNRSFACDITLLGYVSTCTRTTLVGKTELACLVVEDQRMPKGTGLDAQAAKCEREGKGLDLATSQCVFLPSQ